MMTIMNSVQTTEMKDIFGIIYTSANNQAKLTDNYNSILSQRGYLLSKLYYFLDTSALSSFYALTLPEINLLTFNRQSFPKNNQSEIPTYFNADELSLFNLLKKIITDKSEINNDDYYELYSFTRNRKRTEDILNYSTPNRLMLDKKTIEQLLSVITRRTLTTGHMIKLYESLCKDYHLTEESPHILEYKYN